MVEAAGVSISSVHPGLPGEADDLLSEVTDSAVKPRYFMAFLLP
jgi:hypothetical protein